MSDSTWEIDGYLLGDPSVDRQSIERRMLDDADFAMRVAEAAETLDLLAVAARSTQSCAATVVGASTNIVPRNNIHSSHSSATFVWKAVLAIAAILVIGIASTLLFNVTQRGYDEVANSWLALGQEVLPGGSAPVESVAQDGIVDLEAEIAASDIDDEDWLIDSAIAFYSDTDSLGKGSH